MREMATAGVQVPLVALGAMVVAGVLALLLAIRQRRAHRDRTDHVDDRLAHLTAALSLLTDATETGLRDIGVELARLADAHGTVTRPRAAVQQRMAGAARYGRSVQEIAAEEQVSEGEVRLRLELEKARQAAVFHAPLC